MFLFVARRVLISGLAMFLFLLGYVLISAWLCSYFCLATFLFLLGYVLVFGLAMFLFLLGYVLVSCVATFLFVLFFFFLAYLSHSLEPIVPPIKNGVWSTFSVIKIPYPTLFSMRLQGVGRVNLDKILGLEIEAVRGKLRVERA